MRELVLKKFGQTIKSLRLKNGLTQIQLAENCGFDRNYVGMIERGERNPSLLNILILSNSLNSSPGSLLNNLKM